MMSLSQGSVGSSMIADRQTFKFNLLLCSWLNHACHTNIMIFIILEMFLTFHKYPARKVAATSFFITNIAYIPWLFIIKYMTGYWAYPFFDVLNLPLQIGFLICATIFMTSSYFVGELCNNLIWANRLKTAKSED